MATINWISVEEDRLVSVLHEAGKRLDGQEVLLDFSAVQRMDVNGLRAIEEFAAAASGRGVKVVARGVRVDVYRTLKLARLSSRLSYAA